MTSILILALSFLVSLGAELPLGNTALRPAVFNQTLGNIATNGRDFVAVWSDQRNAPYPYSRTALYTGRVDAAGHPVDPPGQLIANSTFGGRVLWTGSSYLLIYMLDTGHTLLQPLDDDGKPAGTAKEADLAVAPREVATNGRNLLTLQYNGAIWLNSLDGPVLWKQLIGEPTDSSEIAVLPNGDYRFAALTQKTVVLVTVDGTTGFIKSTRTLATNVDRMGAYVRPDGSTLVAWRQGAAVQYELVDVTQPATLSTDADNADVAVGWDGHEFAIALTGEHGLRLARVDAGGRLLDATPIDLAGGPAHNVRFAATGTDVLIARDAFNSANFDWDVVARASRNFDDVAASSDQPIASSLPWQQKPRVANGGLTFWFEHDLLAQLPGTGTPRMIAEGQHAAGAGRGTSSYLVAWLDGKNVLARRVAFDGTPIDAEPVVLGESPDVYASRGDSTPAVAFDGKNYLVAWPGYVELFAIRVGQDGRPIDAHPIALTSYDFRPAYPTSVRVVWSGSRFVVAWIDQGYSLSLISPAPPAPVRAAILGVSADGTVLDAAPRFVGENVGVFTGLGLAANGQGLELVWSHACVYELALRNDGSPAGAIRALRCGAVAGADVAWDGSEYVSVWTDVDRVKALRVDVDDEPFDVSPQGGSQPSIGANASGAAIAYVRSVDGVPRAFVRTLQRSGVPPRRRPSK